MPFQKSAQLFSEEGQSYFSTLDLRAEGQRSLLTQHAASEKDLHPPLQALCRPSSLLPGLPPSPTHLFSVDALQATILILQHLVKVLTASLQLHFERHCGCGQGELEVALQGLLERSFAVAPQEAAAVLPLAEPELHYQVWVAAVHLEHVHTIHAARGVWQGEGSTVTVQAWASPPRPTPIRNKPAMEELLNSLCDKALRDGKPVCYTKREGLSPCCPATTDLREVGCPTEDVWNYIPGNCINTAY